METKTEKPAVDVLKETTDTILQESVNLEVDIQPRGWLHQLLQRRRLTAVKKVLTIRPITLGNLVRISRILLQIDLKSITGNNLVNLNFQLIDLYGHSMSEIVAIAVYNRKAPPPQSLIDLVNTEFTSADLARAIGIVLRQMDLSSFTSTIISARGLTVVSPNEQRS
ncbi:MAG TPA: hypothetical protein VGM31_14250 [Puia sp.]|jgi:hypothetical protein